MTTPPAPKAAPSPEAHAWPAIQRVAFRFFAVYLALYGLPLLFPLLPFGAVLSDKWFLATVAIGRWLIIHVLRLPEHSTPPFTDRLDLFLFDLLLVGLGLVVALVWSGFDARRPDYRRLFGWVFAFVRIVLAAEMFSYGWSKVLPYQFWGGRIPLFDVAQPLGQLDPQRLLWAMMGFSRPYAIFGGALEWVGALLLCFRRTATLGAVVLIGTLANVVMLNFAFDVPVKMHAVNLLVMAVFVAAADLGRLANVLLFDRPTNPRPARPLFRSTRLTSLGTVAIAALVAIRPLPTMLTDLRTDGPDAPVPPLYGIFDVDSVVRNGVVAPPLLTDSTRWRRVVFERSRYATVTLMSDSMLRYRSAIDTSGGAVQLSAGRQFSGLRVAGRGDTLRLKYARPSQDHIVLKGTAGGDSLAIWLRYRPPSSYRLLNARHRWAW